MPKETWFIWTCEGSLSWSKSICTYGLIKGKKVGRNRLEKTIRNHRSFLHGVEFKRVEHTRIDVEMGGINDLIDTCDRWCADEFGAELWAGISGAPRRFYRGSEWQMRDLKRYLRELDEYMPSTAPKLSSAA